MRLMVPTDKISKLDDQKINGILRAALKEFSGNSFQQASYNRIIHESGLSKGTMYYYFKSKKDLYQTLVKGIVNGFSQALKKTLRADGDADFWQLTENCLEALFYFGQSQPLVFRFGRIHFAPRDIAIDETEAESGSKKFKTWLEGHLQAGQRNGSIRTDLPLQLLVPLCWSLLETATIWLENQSRMTPLESAALLTDLLSRSLGTETILTPQTNQKPDQTSKDLDSLDFVS